MKIIPIITVLSLLAVPTVSAEEWIIQLQNKKGKAHIVAENPKLSISAAVAGKAVVVNFSDGKQKFGSSVITFTKGDVTYSRPRLKMSIPLDKVKAVTAESPFLVTEFAHKATKFELKFVHNGGGFPDLVIKKK